MNQYILSRKTAHSIQRILQKIRDQTFVEDDIKMLMIDVRELGRKYSMTSPKHERSSNPFFPFVELADSVAHTNRDRGGISDRLTLYTTQTASHLRSFESREQFFLAGMKAQPLDAVNCEKAAQAMLALASSYLDHFGIPEPENFRDSLRHSTPDIALCFICLLQDAMVTIGKDSVASFRIIVHRGLYRLYADIYSPEILSETRRLLGAAGGLASVVIATTCCVDADGVAPRSDHPLMAKPKDAEPYMLETFRGLHRRLHLRPADLHYV